jgi:hypothetical protein
MEKIFSQAEIIDDKRVPKTASEYLKIKHESIANDYRTLDSKHSDSCGLIAVDIAKLLLQEGKRPYIMKISEDIHERGGIHVKELSPKIYKGRVTWGAHQVCCCDRMAYDPIIGSPIDIKKYSKTVFGEDINMEISIPQDEIEEFVNR